MKNKRVQCVKCGSRDINTIYHPGHIDHHYDWKFDGCKNAAGNVPQTVEHLLRSCNNCDFGWRDPVLNLARPRRKRP